MTSPADPRQPSRSPRGGPRSPLRRPLSIVCITYVAAIVAVGVFAPIFLPDVATEQAGDLVNTLQKPSAEHLLGTDTLGRDVLERLLVGTRVSLTGVAIALVVTLAIALPLGLLAGYRRGRAEAAVGWYSDLIFAMPGIIMILVVLAVFPQSMVAAMVTYGVLASPSMIRVVRSATLPVRDELYIDAARVAGLRTGSILGTHILPRIAGAVIVQASLVCGIALLVQTGLAFLQLVVPAPAPSWGGMIAEGLSVLATDPWLSVPSGTVVALTVLVFALLGDAIRDTATESWSSAMRIGGQSDRRPLAPASGGGHDPARHTEDAPSETNDALLQVKHLTVAVRAGAVLLDDVSFFVRSGESVAIVGESGSGKSMTARAIMGLLPASIDVTGGAILFEQTDLIALPERDRRRVRGGSIALISQEPTVTLDPAFRVGQQIAEVVKRHRGSSGKDSWARAVELLDQVELANPSAIARAYPHELSGGMAQRVSIARALAGDPDALIADEPTTALDVTLQASILDLLRRIQQTRHMALLLITHDWGVVADIADRVLVMYAGQLVEAGSAHEIIYTPIHPYTEALLASDIHRVDDASELPSIPGVVPRAGEWPVGCRFHPRCRYSIEACATLPVPLEQVEGRSTRCIRSHELQHSR